MADLLRHELFALDHSAVARDLERADVALSDEAVDLREPRERALGGGAVGDQVVEGRLKFVEAAAVLATEMWLTDADVEAGVAARGDLLLRFRSDEAR